MVKCSLILQHFKQTWRACVHIQMGAGTINTTQSNCKDSTKLLNVTYTETENKLKKNHWKLI